MKDESKNIITDTENCTGLIPSACAVGWVAPLPEPIYNEDGITLYCADCTHVLPLLEPMSADLVLTDPPYEEENMVQQFEAMDRILKPEGSIYVFGNKNQVAENWFRQVKTRDKELLIWYYRNSPKPRGKWRMSMQAIIYAGGKSVFNEDFARVEYMPASLRNNGRMRPSKGRMSKEKPYRTDKGALPRDVIDCPALLGHLSKERIGHRDQKPLALIERIMLTSSNTRQTILDPYCGSGTSLVAAKRLNRLAIGIEISEKWCRKTIERLKETRKIN